MQSRPEIETDFRNTWGADNRIVCRLSEGI